MKTVFSSTEEQEQEIASLVSRFYESVFPQYFTESEILHFREIGVLEPNQSSCYLLGNIKRRISSNDMSSSPHVDIRQTEERRLYSDGI